MARQSAPQKQIITTRQIVIVLAIFMLSVFAFKYAQNVLRIRAAQNTLAELELAVEDVKAQQTAADASLVNGLSPAALDVFAKQEMGWVKDGEEVYVNLAPARDTDDANGLSPEEEHTTEQGEANTPNWRLWLALVWD